MMLACEPKMTVALMVGFLSCFGSDLPWFSVAALGSSAAGARSERVTDIQPSGQAPVMGWTAWKSFHFEANETDVRAAADGLVSSGMHAAGYRTLSLDGGWWGGGKSGKVRRNASGYLTVNESKFPSSGTGGNAPGMLPLSRYITARGLAFGIYTSANTVMCSKDVGGSGGNEEKDAALFASWNISLLKLDDCGSPAAAAQGVMEKWRTLFDQLVPQRRIMLMNSQVGCCTRGSGGCSAKMFGPSLPEWCYQTSTTMYQPADGDDMWDVIT